MEMSFKKSTKMADEFRIEGNRCYIRKQYLDALIYYNKSLCYAEQGSESFAFAFANRASVYLESKLFRKCLKNIQLAKENNYPKDKMRILNERELKCKSQMKNNYGRERKIDNWNVFELTHPANKKIPYIVDCLEVKSNEKYGRYIITNKDLSVGDIVAIEEPSCQVLFDVTKGYSYCVYCCKDELLDLLPCSDCVTTMFCSAKCKDSAMKTFHNYECRNQEILSEFSSHYRFAYRLFFKALSMFNDSIDDFEQFINKTKNTKVTVFDLDFSNPNNIENDKNRLLAMIALNDHDSNYNDNSFPTLIERVFPGKRKLAQYFLSRVENMSKLHSHRIDAWSLDKSKSVHHPTLVDSFGTYLFSALVNHSCAPNVRGFYVENRIVMYVKRPIPKGEQLFECYNTLYLVSTKDVRQGALLNHYQFICDCEACVGNYPTFNNMIKSGGYMFNYAMKSFDELGKLNASQAKEKYLKHCEMMQRRPQLANTFEGAIIYDCIQSCLMTIIKTFQIE